MASPCFRLCLALLLAGAGQAVYPDHPTHLTERLIVTYGLVPDPFHWTSFFDLPRIVEKAETMKFAMAINRTSEDNTTLWCRGSDYRVCVLFDIQGSVAGLQVSTSVREIHRANLPFNMDDLSQWFRQTLLGVDVYSTLVYFVDDATLNTGRLLMDSSPTAPSGLRIVDRAAPNGIKEVPREEEHAEGLGFTRQSCFIGMGQHYSQISQTKCEDHNPYFMLYGKQTKKLLGFGFQFFGRASNPHGYFEHPVTLAVQLITPNRPPCLLDWLNKYGLTTMHVYFVDKPWKITC